MFIVIIHPDFHSGQSFSGKRAGPSQWETRCCVVGVVLVTLMWDRNRLLQEKVGGLDTRAISIRRQEEVE